MLDLFALGLAQAAHFKQAIDKKTQPQIGGEPPGGGVGRVDQAQCFQIRHHIAHRGGRKRDWQLTADIARADWIAGRQERLDDLAENIARSLVKFRQVAPPAFGHGLGCVMQFLLLHGPYLGRGPEPVKRGWRFPLRRAVFGVFALRPLIRSIGSTRVRARLVLKTIQGALSHHAPIQAPAR